jgi:hypothetical protein
LNFKTALLAWVLAIGVVVALGIYRGEFSPEEAKAVPTTSIASRQLDDVIACKAREDAERLAVAFNKTTELSKALEDPKSEAASVSSRLMLSGRCAHFEHQVSFKPLGMAFDGSSFAPVLATPFNVVEADMALVQGTGRFYLVTEWKLDSTQASKPVTPL